MIEIDGSDGGGQVLRTALGLSARTGDPVRVENVRGNRPTPGLGAQHLTALRAVAAVADADASGDELGAETVEFRPGSLDDGDDAVSVDVGTAGSVALVFDAILPVADALSAPVSVRATGGTDVRWSPTADHYRRVKLPLLARFGVDAPVATNAETAETTSPGAAVLVRARYDRTLAGFDEVGEKGVPAERVAEDAVGRFARWRDGPGVVDARTADQLLPFVALAGGTVRIPRVTDHVRTNADAVRAFGYALDVKERTDGSAVVTA